MPVALNHQIRGIAVKKISRLLVVVGALIMLGGFFLPLWQIRLVAPQYPEGLGMYIRLDTVTGATEFDLGNINKLNHYIGMRAIDPNSIPELRFMPWILGALIVAGIAAGLAGKRRLVMTWLIALVIVGIAGIADFWRWGYDYGHNLDRNVAVIEVPGMSYQPPLVGSKQLLNFTATSWPASGAYMLGISAALAAVALIIDRRRGRGAVTGRRLPVPLAASTLTEVVRT